MAKYVLKLRQDNDIPSRMRNQDWNIANLCPGFVIQLRVRHVVLHTEHQRLRRTNTTSNKFFYMEGGNFLSYWGIHQFLLNILAHERVPLHPNGRILCPSGLQLVWPNVAEPSMAGAPSEPIYSLERLTDRVSRQVWSINNEPRNRYLNLVPIAMDLEILKFHQPYCADDAIILDDQFLRANTSNVVAPVPVRAVEEEIIQVLYPGKDCSICLEDFCVGQTAARMPCTHLFHAKCIAPWLEKASSCPLCRAPARSF